MSPGLVTSAGAGGNAAGSSRALALGRGNRAWQHLNPLLSPMCRRVRYPAPNRARPTRRACRRSSPRPPPTCQRCHRHNVRRDSPRQLWTCQVLIQRVGPGAGFGGPGIGVSAGARLRDPARAGPRRHGRGVPGPASGPQPPRRAEDDPHGRPGRAGRAGALPHRGGGRGPHAAPQHRANLRNRRMASRRRQPADAVFLAGVLRRRRPERPGGQRHAGPAPGRSCGRDLGTRHARGPPARHRPPRPEAAEHPAGRRPGRAD